MLSPPRITRFEGDNGPYRLSVASRNAAERCFPELFSISVVNDAFLSPSPPKVESLHDFLKRWRVETRVWISRFEKNCVISVYIREIVVCTRNRVIKFIRSILILKGNFYSFENIYCIFFLAGVCRVFQNKAIF